MCLLSFSSQQLSISNFNGIVCCYSSKFTHGIFIVKSSIILIFLLLRLHYSRSANSTICMNQEYQRDTDENLEKQFLSEFSVFTQITETIFALIGLNKDIFNDVERLKELCACAMYERNEKIQTDDKIAVKSYEEILKQIKKIKKGPVYAAMSYYFFDYHHGFSAFECQFDQDSCIIVRGLRKKSDTKLVYDVYVGNNEKDAFEFQGIIKDIDVGLPTKVSPSS